MLYFLYGPDTFRSRQKLREIIAAFQEKAGGVLNVTRLDAEERPEAVLAVGHSSSLFAEKELIVIENISLAPSAIHDYIRPRLASWKTERNLTVIFWEREIKNGENAIIQAVKSNAVKSQEFQPLTGSRLERWIENQASALGLRLELAERRILAAQCGPDLWAIGQELAKIKAGWSLLKAVKQEEKIWNFTGVFFQNRRRSFRPLANLLQSGLEPIYILGALAGHLRRLAVTAGKRKYDSAPEIPRLRKYFSALTGADAELKTGKLPSPLPLLKLILGRPKSKTPA